MIKKKTTGNIIKILSIVIVTIFLIAIFKNTIYSSTKNSSTKNNSMKYSTMNNSSTINNSTNYSSARDASTNIENNSIYETDPNTMDNYIDKLITPEVANKNSGRIWTDKSVSKDKIELDMETDGYIGAVETSNDFLHSFSALGSSQGYIGQMPIKLVIVIDNSGSMYSNDKSNFENTRIYNTVTAVNRIIDKILRASEFNEISVVLFGNGNKNGENRDYDNTAETIVEMAHYPISDSEDVPYKYLDAGWKSKKTEEDIGLPNNPIQDSEAENINKEGGFVYVDKAYINENGEVDNNLMDLQGTDRYNLYGNGTTNITAGIYQGMKTLLDSEETLVLGNYTIDCVPELIVLTDGEATDTIKGTYANPSINGHIEQMGFLNDFSEKNTSFVGSYNNNKGELAYSWNQFIKEYEGEEESQYEYELIAKGNPNSSNDPLDTDIYKLKEISENFKMTKENMILNTLMMAGYMKAAINEKYNNDLSTYTISVDMPNPTAENYSVQNKSTISINGPMMNPSQCFNKQWLINKGFLVNDEEDEDGTSYEADSVGADIVISIDNAITHWNEWKEGQDISAKINKYQQISSGQKLYSSFDESKQKILGLNGTPKHENFFLVSPCVSVNNYHHLEENDNDNNPYNLKDKDVEVNYVTEAYYATTKDEAIADIGDTFDEILKKIINRPFVPVNEKVMQANILNSLTYIDPLGKYMEIKRNAINENDISQDMEMLLFGKMYGIGIEAIYDPEFINSHPDFKEGWYSKDGIYIEGDGSYEEEDTYYINLETLKEHIPQIANNVENNIYTIYKFTDSKEEIDKYRWNDCYDEEPSTDQNQLKDLYNNGYRGIYRIKDIKIWTEKINNDTILYVNIPANALPLQTITIGFDKTKKVNSCKTNLENKTQSTPMRLFYAVGINDSNKDSLGNIEISTISEDYIDNNKRTENGEEYLYFYSNYYNDEDQNKFGNTKVTYEPSKNNQYYFFQNNFIIYQEISAEGDKEVLSRPLTDLSQIDQNKEYYYKIDYYENGNNIEDIVKKKGSEFIDISGQNCLTYYDTQTKKEVSEPGDNIVVATKIGAKREKQFTDNPQVQLKENNNTNTSNYCYVSENEANKSITTYLGNNGVFGVKVISPSPSPTSTPEPTKEPTPTPEPPTPTPTEEPTPTPEPPTPTPTEEPTPTPMPPTPTPTEEPTPTPMPPTNEPDPTPFEDDPLPTIEPDDDDSLTLDDYYEKASLDKYDNDDTYTKEYEEDTPSEGTTVYKTNIPSSSPDTGDAILLMGIIFGISFIGMVLLIIIKIKTEK